MLTLWWIDAVTVSHVWHWLCTICIRLFTLSSVSHVWHWLHNLHLTLYTVICQPCLTLTKQSASDSLHCHLSAMSDTDYTICIWPFTLSSVSRVWHCIVCLWLFTPSSVSHVWHCIVCLWLFTPSSVSHVWHWLCTIYIWLFTLSWTDAETVRHVWHWLCTVCLSGLSDARESTKQSLVLDRRRLVCCCFLGVLVLVITCFVNPLWSELVGAVYAEGTYLHTCT